MYVCVCVCVCVHYLGNDFFRTVLNYFKCSVVTSMAEKLLIPNDSDHLADLAIDTGNGKSSEVFSKLP